MKLLLCRNVSISVNCSDANGRWLSFQRSFFREQHEETVRNSENRLNWRLRSPPAFSFPNLFSFLILGQKTKFFTRSTNAPPFAILTACLSLSALAQAPRPALTADQVTSIDTFVAREMQHEQIPGVAIGVYSRGTIILAKGYGFANIELNVAVKPETIFQSGSVGKQFVSAAIMMLAEEGKLSIDESVTKYFQAPPPPGNPFSSKTCSPTLPASPNTRPPSIPGPAGPSTCDSITPKTS